MNLNTNQVLAILLAVLGALIGASAQLTDLFGVATAKYIVSAAGLIQVVVGSIVAVLTGQSAMVKNVAAMPGVEAIKVNEQANQTLAAIATDPAHGKIAPTPQAAATVQQIAKGA